MICLPPTVLRRLLCAVPVMVFVAGCERAVIAPDDTKRLSPLEISAGTQPYRILPSESRLVLRVYRAGRMAALGHNHIISTGEVYGDVYIGKTPADSSAELSFAVASLEVDLPALRAEFGDDFPGEIDEDDVSGTRNNMLGPDQLDAVNWPDIVIRTRTISGAWPDLQLRVELAIQGRLHTLDIPAVAQINGDTLVATAAFPLVQTELGLTPFSVMMGALRVRDQIDAELTIVATAQ